MMVLAYYYAIFGWIYQADYGISMFTSNLACRGPFSQNLGMFPQYSTSLSFRTKKYLQYLSMLIGKPKTLQSWIEIQNLVVTLLWVYCFRWWKSQWREDKKRKGKSHQYGKDGTTMVVISGDREERKKRVLDFLYFGMLRIMERRKAIGYGDEGPAPLHFS